MADIDSFNQKHPFQFKIEGVFGFKQHIEELIEEKLFELALNHIEVIREKYVVARNLSQIKENSFVYWHFNDYWKEQMDLSMNGQTYPDGSKDKVIFELNELKRKVDDQKKGKLDPITIPEKGIVLYFLMYYGSGDFKKTRQKEELEEHLRTLKLKTGSGTTIYTKGIVHLITDVDRNDGEERKKTRTNGVFTRQEFLNAIDFLKKKDGKAHDYALNEFDYLCGENANRGNDQSFFKNN